MGKQLHGRAVHPSRQRVTLAASHRSLCRKETCNVPSVVHAGRVVRRCVQRQRAGRAAGVYNCYADGECAHAVTSQEWTAELAELVIGEPAPVPGASIVCIEGGDCVWSPLSESEIEVANGGDGAIEPIEVVDLDGYPAELPDLDFDEVATPTDETSSRRVWAVICEDGTCRATRSKLTRSEAEILLNEEIPDDDFYILCDEEG